MKTILVTGAAGYIGRHVVKNALDRGCKVIASDFSFKGVDERAEFCARWAARTSASTWPGGTVFATTLRPI